MSAILDTSALIASWDAPHDDVYAISVVSLAELHFGVLKATGTPALASRLRRLSEVENARLYTFNPQDFRSLEELVEVVALPLGASAGTSTNE